jgi:hypothetical protein
MRKLYLSLSLLLGLSCAAQPWSGASTGGATLIPYPITNVTMYAIACYGDSLTLGAFGGTETFPNTLGLASHRFTLNYGVSGATSSQISTAMLADTNNYGTYVLWSGRNNYTATAVNAPFNSNPWCTNQAFNDICYDANWCATNGHKRLLILSVINSYSGSWPGTEGSGTALYNGIINLNNAISNAFPSQYFDIRGWLVRQADLSTYRTAGETNALLYDVPAYHLLTTASPPHLNGAGYEAVGTQVAALLSTGFPNGNTVTVEQMMTLLSSNAYYYNPANPVSPLLFPSLFFAPQLGFHVMADEFEVGFSGNMLSDNGGNLGAPAFPFNQIYAATLNATNIAVVSNITASGTITNLPICGQLTRTNWTTGQPGLIDITNYSTATFSGGFTGSPPNAPSGAITNPVAGFYFIYGASDWDNNTETLTVFTNGVASSLSCQMYAQAQVGSTPGREVIVQGILSLPATTAISLRFTSSSSSFATTNGILGAYLLH